MNELISVVVPVFNVENLLERCVRSIQNQSHHNLEILLIDDGSEDESGRLADEFAEKDKRIRVIHQNNGGLSAARNTGLDICTGTFICFVDSDDWIEPDMCSSMLSAIIQYNTDIAVCGRFDDRSTGTEIRFTSEAPFVMNNDECVRRILTWDHVDIAACDKLFKRSLWEGIRFPAGINNEDICVIPIIISRAKAIIHVGGAYYHYVHRENSITTTYNTKKINDFNKAIDTISVFVRETWPDIEDELIYYLNHQYLGLLVMMEMIGYQGEKRKLAEMYIKENWGNPASLRRMSNTDRIIKLMLDMHVMKFAQRVRKVIKRGKAQQNLKEGNPA